MPQGPGARRNHTTAASPTTGGVTAPPAAPPPAEAAGTMAPPQTASTPTPETAVAFARTMQQLDATTQRRRKTLSSARRYVSSSEVAVGPRWKATRLALEHRDEIERLAALKHSPRAPGLARHIEMSRPISGEFEEAEQDVRSPPSSPAPAVLTAPSPAAAAVMPPSGSPEAIRLTSRKLGKFISTSELNVADVWKASKAALRAEAGSDDDDGGDLGWGFGEPVG